MGVASARIGFRKGWEQRVKKCVALTGRGARQLRLGPAVTP